MRLQTIVFMLGLLPLVARGAEPGDSVVVVYNSTMPESKDVAMHYAEVRHVPARQIFGLELPSDETISREDYYRELRDPLLNCLEREKLLDFSPERVGTNPHSSARAAFRYLVLCYGVPVRIPDDPSIHEDWTNPAQVFFQGRNGGAVDSELALLPLTPRHLKLTGGVYNTCFAVTNAALMDATNGVLIVARLDGPSAAIARALVDKAVSAETNGLWGRAYFDQRGLTNGSYKLGDDWIGAAARLVRAVGYETVVDDRPETFSAAFPMSQIALYAGWYDGNVSGPFTRPEVEFMPGAFAYHLHSFSAHRLRSSTENWCGPLLAKGATATMGCVDEPYLEYTPNIEVFFYRWIVRGFTFGEAALASQPYLSWQTTVVGDPLYRPFRGNEREQYEDLLRRKSPLLDWSVLRWVDYKLAQGGAVSNYIQLLELDPAANLRPSPILKEKLGDLYWTNRETDASIQAYRQALTLNPTPQTEVRLTMELADELTSASRGAEALKVYEAFLAQHPDYPDALSLYQKMLSMALSLGQTHDAVRYNLEAIKRREGH